MKHNLDNLAVAIQLIRERGDDAVAYSRARLVELIAANHHSGAVFWREVLKACEAELARQRAPLPTACEIGQAAAMAGAGGTPPASPAPG